MEVDQGSRGKLKVFVAFGIADEHRREGNVRAARAGVGRRRANNVLLTVFKGIKHRAARKKVPFTISFEFFERWVLENRYLNDRGKECLCLHIDRKIPSLGYTEDNIQVLTCTENTAKGNWERHQPWYKGETEEVEGDPF